METDKHYLLVGSFVISILAVAAIFSVWLVGIQDSRKYTDYQIRFAESVSGLTVGGPVKFRGVSVGKVNTITIDQNDTRLIRVNIRILKTTPIKTDTVASLKFQGITGAIFVELTGGSPQAPILASKDDSPPEIPSKANSLNEVMDILPEILKQVSHIAEQVDKLFNDRNIASFNDMMENWQKASRNISQLTHNVKDDPSKLLFPPKEKGIPAP